jgi:hypothetical protein
MGSQERKCESNGTLRAVKPYSKHGLMIWHLNKEVDDGKWLKDGRKIVVITPLRRGRPQ